MTLVIHIVQRLKECLDAIIAVQPAPLDVQSDTLSMHRRIHEELHVTAMTHPTRLWLSHGKALALDGGSFYFA
jgi:hypothetical protein